MKNIIFETKYLWTFENIERAISFLNCAFEESTGLRAFNVNSYLLSSNLSFDVGLNRLLTDDFMMVQPYGKIYEQLWNSAPIQLWIDSFVQKNISNEQYKNEEIYRIIDIIEFEILSGKLSINDIDYWLSGRIVISKSQILEMTSENWNDTYNKVLKKLPDSTPLQPSYWEDYYEKSPEEIVSYFLFNYFFIQNWNNETFMLRWQGTVYRHKEYAAIVIKSLKYILEENNTTVDYNYLVKFSAGQKNITKSKIWLQRLLNLLTIQMNRYSES